ncbi:hypothetical protein PMZ80_009903 [Knufia obscura]|uniref:Uncharacterized protein n=1 Tax=Knufia obscura TaxID=1635080 RepID=A0ABR0RC33_9EURO|nr:hypothetical protein PMZ80_009903 [Knufia obscura]
MSNLNVAEFDPQLLLGYESCKHQKHEDDDPTDHPKLLAEEMPTSLEELWLHVDRSHVFRNGDDHFIHFIRALIDNPGKLPSLKVLGLVPGSDDEGCDTCVSWYGTEVTDGDETAYIMQHEYDRLCRLAKLRGIEVQCQVVCLPDIPVHSPRRGLTMRRIEKINKRRSWYDADRDEDMGLFELFNT